MCGVSANQGSYMVGVGGGHGNRQADQWRDGGVADVVYVDAYLVWFGDGRIIVFLRWSGSFTSL